MLAPLILLFALADWKPVEQALGRSGSLQPGGVYKVGFPRTDLAVTAGGVAVKPALALGSWAAFKENMVMGDLVLLESEVNRVSPPCRRAASSRARCTII